MSFIRTSHRSLACSIAGCVVATTAAAQDAPGFVWNNVHDFPASLTMADDTWAWSAIRSEPPDFVSYRVAADDFVLDAETTITKITFYSVHIDPPTIIGGDWYIFRDDQGRGQPGTLAAFDSGVPMEHRRFGISHPTYGDLYENVMEPKDLTLPAGRYFLAFRSFQSMPLPLPGKPNNAAITERWTNGNYRAMWNMNLLGDGTPTNAWQSMKEFNQVEDQEWAFVIEGGGATCYADCDTTTGSGVLDVFDFLCFQDSFVSGEPYACECDTSTGPGVCDVFDFLCFQDSFVAGCP